MAYLLIRQGLQECIVCGGAEEVNVYSVGNFDALSAFSAREEEPVRASRPFDRSRDGLVPSGGAATSSSRATSRPCGAVLRSWPR